MLKPAGPRVLIKPDPIIEEEKTESGIVIGLGSYDKRLKEAAQQTGVVVAVGDQAWTYANGNADVAWADVGDRVVYSKFGGRVIVDPTDKEAQYIILNDEDILAVIKEQE